MRRVLFAVNVLLAIVFLAGAASFYWFLYRALPRTSGRVSTQVSQPVEIDRDSLGFPHIKARTLDDVWFAEGYATAEDRMFQMDGLRRAAAGELAAIAGSSALESDREARRLRMRRIAEQVYIAMDPSDKSAMEAYARGVNAYIETHRGRYGIEFTLLRYDPRPWSVVDSILCGLYMFRNLSASWKNKLIEQQMLQAGEPGEVHYLFPDRAGFEFTPGGDGHPGSNAWAVSGAHTADGKPLLANDMHLEFSIPGIWHMEYLEAPGMKVAGVSLPGMPGILSGHNDHIAWGETNLGFDVQDLYIEKIDLRTGRYLFDGRIEQARTERDIIEIKGGGREEVTTLVTRHGPVFQIDNGQVMTLKWIAAEPGMVADVFLDIDRARDWKDFRKAISRYGGPAQNFVYADVDGNIGYQVAGKLPIRRNYTGDTPVDGSSGNFEWQGYIPFDELPQAWNPAGGYIVTANQNPFPADYPYHVGGTFDSPYRSIQIRDMLRAGGNKLKPADSLRIEKDVYSGQLLFIARQVVAAYGNRKAPSPVFADAIELLRNWNGQMDRDQAAPLIATLTFNYLRKAVAERASPGNSELYTARMAPAVIEHLLRERPAAWFSDYNQVLLQAFADGMDEGERMQGSNSKRWRWGKYMYLAVDNPVVGKVPMIGKYFNIGPVPLSGGPTTVKQTTKVLGPSERMNISLGDWDASLGNLPFGESGHVASRHYRDEWDAYYAGESFPMQFDRLDAKGTLMLLPAK